jgi:hypothetical protein
MKFVGIDALTTAHRARPLAWDAAGARQRRRHGLGLLDGSVRRQRPCIDNAGEMNGFLKGA